ncbi:MAG: M20/M25/M40 family metallo-hydrolase, partial [Bacteroidetes bacterium]|nr:M20/M25/M40 family metallo-hydrolase [Bacteroidota bacterium]
DSVIFQNKKLVRKGNDFVFTLFDENDINKQTIFISIDNKNAIAGLIRKLPYYGKYSYLAFSGDEPTNIAKGQWPVLNSPLIKTFSKDAQEISLIETREALATLKPVFSEKRMMLSIKYLASEELKGRGLGTPEIDQAAAYIAQEFEAAGLMPLKGSYYQKFTHKFDEKGELDLTNVMGIIPGTDPVLKEEVVVISAHYDHLGFGWPDVRKGNEGMIHYGADDNASGVAILIELAHSMAKTVKAKRTIVFLACTAEEAGLVGSRYFVAHSKDYFKGEIFANINLDTDGSLFDKKLLVLNANTAKEWKFIFMGTDYTTGVKSEVIDKDLDASDQFAFIEKGIPAVQLFTGGTENYHRPTDTYEKIDGKGLVKVAIVSKEVLVYLADREDPMNFTGKAPGITKAPEKSKTNRRVSTGSIPDFAYQGKGVKISSVISGSAGEKAGLQAGDIIIELDGVKTDDLKSYSDLLKKYQPDDVVQLKILREDKEETISLKLGER